MQSDETEIPPVSRQPFLARRLSSPLSFPSSDRRRQNESISTPPLDGYEVLNSPSETMGAGWTLRFPWKLVSSYLPGDLPSANRRLLDERDPILLI